MEHIDEVDKFCSDLETVLLQSYRAYLVNKLQSRCAPAGTNGSIGALNRYAFNISLSSFKIAYTQIVQDIRILLYRRGKRIGKSRPSEGKIAGIIAFRLARNAIIHISPGCINCKEHCLTKLNTVIAIRCALDYIGKHYLRVGIGIRKELAYTMLYRHVNQETLGLVFDTIRLL
jgi:hypothetical protein